MTNITYVDDKIEIIKSVINSNSVSLEQIGMVALLLFGEFETVNTRSIINSVSNGQTTVTKSMKALEKINVLSKNRRMANGRFSAYEYVLSKANDDSLDNASSCVVKPNKGKPCVDKSIYENTVCGETTHDETTYGETTYSRSTHDNMDTSYIYNIYDNLSNLSYDRDISYDDLSITSYHDRDRNDDKIDKIDNTNTSDDLFLLSLSNPISYPTCPSNFTENNKSNESNEIDARRAYEDYRDVPCNEQVDNVNAKSQINCVKSQICYDTLINDHKEDKDLIDLIANIMSETYASVSPCTRISGKFVATRNVVTWLMKLGKDDIEYVIDCVKNNSREIRSIKPYLLTSLYNAAANQDNRKLSEKYGNGKNKKKIELRNDDCQSTINWDLYDKIVEEQTKMFEKLGAGKITLEQFEKNVF